MIKTWQESSAFMVAEATPVIGLETHRLMQREIDELRAELASKEASLLLYTQVYHACMKQFALIRERQAPVHITDDHLDEIASACTPNTETGTLNYRAFARAVLAVAVAMRQPNEGELEKWYGGVTLRDCERGLEQQDALETQKRWHEETEKWYGVTFSLNQRISVLETQLERETERRLHYEGLYNALKPKESQLVESQRQPGGLNQINK